MTDPERLMISGSGFEQSLLGAGVAEKPSAALVARMEQGLGLGGAATATATATLSGKLIAAIAATATVGGIALWGLAGQPPTEPLPTDVSVGIAVQDNAGQDNAGQDNAVQDNAGQHSAEQAPANGEADPIDNVVDTSTKVESTASERDDSANGEVAEGSDDHNANDGATHTRVTSSRSGTRVPSSTVSGTSVSGTSVSGTSVSGTSVSGTSARLKEEVRLLDKVRGALESGQTTRAKSLLDQYQSRFPEGVLRPEARKLRQNANSL